MRSKRERERERSQMNESDIIQAQEWAADAYRLANRRTPVECSLHWQRLAGDWSAKARRCMGIE